jgi:hypothetical protein
MVRRIEVRVNQAARCVGKLSGVKVWLALYAGLQWRLWGLLPLVSDVL